MNRYEPRPYLDFVRDLYPGKDAAHDFRRIERIIRRLPEMSAGMPEPRKNMLYFLACFHGLAGRLRDDDNLRGQVLGFLKGLGWTAEEGDAALLSLERHLDNPQSVEEQIVHDANYVELLGALGIAKAFTTGGARGQTFEETADIFESRYLNQVEFYTGTGRRLAEEGRAFAREFLRRLREEW